MGFHEPSVVGIGPSEHPRHVDGFFLGIVVFVAEPDVSGQLVRLDAQVAGVDVPPDGAFAAYGLQVAVAFVDVVQGLPFQDPFRDDGIHFRDRLFGYAFVNSRLMPLPDGKRVRVDAVVVSLPAVAELGLGASVAAIWPGLPAFASPRFEKGAPAVSVGRPFGSGASLLAMGAGMPAVFVGEVAQDLAVDRGPGFGEELGGLGQRPPLGDGGLEVDPVVVPDSLLFLHVSVSFLRAAGKKIIGKGARGRPTHGVCCN